MYNATQAKQAALAFYERKSIRSYYYTGWTDFLRFINAVAQDGCFTLVIDFSKTFGNAQKLVKSRLTELGYGVVENGVYLTVRW